MRGFVLLAAGSLLVHELTLTADRLLGRAEENSAHGYLPLAAVVVCLLLVAAGGLFVRDLFRARRGQPFGGTGLSFRAAWIGATSWLALGYVLQEGAEAYVSGHAVLDAIAAGRGGVAFAFAALVGALVALLLRSARAVLALVARRHRTVPRLDAVRPRRPSQADRPPRAALAWHLAGRGPPLAH